MLRTKFFDRLLVVGCNCCHTVQLPCGMRIATASTNVNGNQTRSKPWFTTADVPMIPCDRVYFSRPVAAALSRVLEELFGGKTSQSAKLKLRADPDIITAVHRFSWFVE